MSRHKAPRCNPREMVLLPGDRSWPFGGYEFVGGRVELGDNVELLRDWNYGPHTHPSTRTALGTLLYSSVGYTCSEIGSELNLGPYYVKNVMVGLRAAVNVRQHHMVLSGAFGADVLRITEHGKPVEDFRANLYRLGQLGLLSRGVNRSLVAKACDIDNRGLSAALSQLSIRERVRRVTGCIAAGFITEQLALPSGMPPLLLVARPDTEEPLDLETEWDALVYTTDEAAFIERFRRLGLDRISAPTNQLAEAYMKL